MLFYAPSDDVDPEESVLKADPFAQLKLLDLQAVDSDIDRLAHRLETLPENARLKELSERRSDLETHHGQTQTRLDDLGQEQRKADADVEQVKARRSRNLERIDAGLVGDPKQLQALQHEIESLNHRIADLEDVELDIMERLESAQSDLSSMAAELSDVEAQIADQQASRDNAAADIVSHQTDAKAERDKLATEIPAHLLALYDRLRAQLGGVGAGALERRRCGGCRLDIGVGDLAKMTAAPSDEVLRCEECNRILVRTPESGN
ncbi:MAG: zinc ribbon domain-containing protein [Nocardioidaceae bacterium]